MHEEIKKACKIISDTKKLTVLTGAGISAESGIPTFRGPGGLWQKYNVAELATPEAFKKDPKLVWEFYNWRRELISKAKCNPAHKALVKLEEKIPKFCLITQNIDGLHLKAGNRNIIELHGNIWWVRCTRCSFLKEDRRVPLPFPPLCPNCQNLLRPHVVWFGEPLDLDILNLAIREAETAETFLIIGTSATVQPAASLIWLAKEKGAFLIEINPEPSEATPIVDIYLKGKAGEILPKLI